MTDCADSDIDALFKYYYKLWGGKEVNSCSEVAAIPRLFHRVPGVEEILPQKLREEARAIVLEAKNEQLLDNMELQNLWATIEKFHSPPDIGGGKYISYENFKLCAEEVSFKAKTFFTPSVYAKLIADEDPLSRVNMLTFFNYVMKTTWYRQTRIGLSLYDATGEGYLTEADLENYIAELISSLPQLASLEAFFEKFYVCTAVRKFLFFLDPLHVNRVRITDILASGFLDSLLELREEQISDVQLATNWFSHQSAIRVYGTYLQLDLDKDGMLSWTELSRYGNGTLTETFIKRVFEECTTYNGQMDYKSYLDFVLAMENKQEPQALAYLFRVLDMGGTGKLTGFVLKHFYTDIEARLQIGGHQPPAFSDIQNEIFDMVEPSNEEYITLNDLLRCGKGDVVVSILIDLQGFLSHENREMLMADLPDEAEL